MVELDEVNGGGWWGNKVALWFLVFRLPGPDEDEGMGFKGGGAELIPVDALFWGTEFGELLSWFLVSVFESPYKIII